MPLVALKIEFYDGEFRDYESVLTRLATLSGTVEGLPPKDFHREITVLLEMCEKRYAAPTPSGSALTIYVCRKEGKAQPSFARFDISLQDGIAKASLSFENRCCIDAEPVAVHEDDDVVSIARAVLNVVKLNSVDLPWQRTT